jgi:hypothetical protein
MITRPPAPKIKQPDRTKLADIMGPGLITGASDDDPSGIATYSQAGAQFGYSLGWTLLLTYPLMCAIQMISAQVGRVSGKGLAGNMRRQPRVASASCAPFRWRGASPLPSSPALNSGFKHFNHLRLDPLHQSDQLPAGR